MVPGKTPSSLFPRACSNSCPISWWCHPTISSSVFALSSCPQFFPAPGGQGIGASASVLPMNIQGWFPIGLTGSILLSKGLSRVFSSPTVPYRLLKSWERKRRLLRGPGELELWGLRVSRDSLSACWWWSSGGIRWWTLQWLLPDKSPTDAPYQCTWKPRWSTRPAASACFQSSPVSSSPEF